MPRRCRHLDSGGDIISGSLWLSVLTTDRGEWGMIKIRRAYEEPDRGDGYRVLVDRLWPRGLGKADAKIDFWLKDIAPSNALRRRFSHNPEKWLDFKRRYFRELKNKAELADLLLEKAKKRTVTLLYGAKDETFNNAAALKEYLETFHMRNV